MPNDKDYIILYRTMVEQKLMLGDGSGRLRQRDFEYLTELIEQKSRVKLSLSTLKRIWKQDIEQMPHPTTLDALVSLFDISDWQTFKKENSALVKQKVAHPRPERNRTATLFLIAAVSLVVGVAAFFLLQGFHNKNAVVITGNVTFTADKMASAGVPNTVGFSYDLSAVQADSFFIQQSWNPRDKTPLDPRKKFYSAIYYTPGFHFARIMANDSVLKYQKVHIQTDGWLPLVKYDVADKRPIYLDAERLIEGGSMRVSPQLLRRANVQTDKDFVVRYYNVRDFEHVSSSDFDLETRFKCDSLSFDGRVSTVPCPNAEVMILTEEGIFFVPVTKPGCVNELSLLIGEEFRSGVDNDLSSLGISPFNWQTLRIRNNNRSATIYLNEQKIFELRYQKDFGAIKGLIFTFTGGGSVDFVRLQNCSGTKSYYEEF